MNKLTFVAALTLCSGPIAWADTLVVDPVTVTFVAVNGGADSANPGTSCVTVSAPVSSQCTGGLIAIPNNNKQLLASLLQAKAFGSNVWLYYAVSSDTQHCPGQAFTQCSVISVGLR